MAPSFFSKLVKGSAPSNHTRDRSTESAPSSTSRLRTFSNPATSNFPSGFSSNNKSRSSQRDSAASSLGPNVTVIPPSPRTTVLNEFGLSNSSLGHQDPSKDVLPEVNGDTNVNANARSSSKDRRRPSFSITIHDTSASHITDDTTASSNPASARTLVPKKDNNAPPSQSRTLTPASSTGNLELVRQRSGNMRSTVPPVPPVPADLRPKSSNKSINANLPPISTSHVRSATTPVPGRGQEEEDSITMNPIVESPTGINHTHSFSDSVEPTTTSTLQTPRTAESDAVSIRSARSTVTNNPPSKGNSDLFTTPLPTPKKKRTWRRNSQTRKPTGLASAIAASGLAMVNPAMSPPIPVLSPQAPNGIQRTATQQSRKSSVGSPPRTRTSLDLPRKRGRRPSASMSVSIHSENNSEIYSDDREYSGLGNSSDENESGSEDDLMDLELTEDDIPVTGFAVASNKRNADFHELFPNIPDGDYLIEDYGCALQREILIQGRIYISENHICFHANIFGWITDLSIPIFEIITLEKKMTAFVIPNAIQMTTRQAKYTFASFLSRDTTFDVIFNIWRLARPEDSASILGSVRGSFEGNRLGTDYPREGQIVTGTNGVVAKPVVKKVTQCACGREGRHYSETALDTVLPGTPDRIYSLMFTSGFIKDFMRDDQKLLDIQISDWSPGSTDPKLLARNMSYIKPLTASLGPKQTKCELRDETVYLDFEDYVSTLTTTRTPDVPSGGVFSVKTRTCLMWASAISTKVIVTTQVEWTGRSFIKGIIEKSAIDGQKVYHADLDTAMRVYIQAHHAEFIPAGVDPAAVALAEPEIAAAAAAAPITSEMLAHEIPLLPEELRKKREKEQGQRGLQWAWDTFEGASQVAKQSAKGALELIRDGWESSTSTTILYFVIVILVISNLWTLVMVGRREEAGRMKEIRKMEDREKWIQGVVTALWDELAAGKGGPGLVPTSASAPASSPLPALASSPVNAPPASLSWQAEEVARIQQALDVVEQRVQAIKQSLNALD